MTWIDDNKRPLMAVSAILGVAWFGGRYFDKNQSFNAEYPILRVQKGVFITKTATNRAKLESDGWDMKATLYKPRKKGNWILQLTESHPKLGDRYKTEVKNFTDGINQFRKLSDFSLENYAETFGAESEDCEVCYTTVDKGTLNDVQAGRICNECHRMNQYTGGTRTIKTPYNAEMFDAERIQYNYTVHREPKGSSKGGWFKSKNAESYDAETFEANEICHRSCYDGHEWRLSGTSHLGDYTPDGKPILNWRCDSCGQSKSSPEKPSSKADIHAWEMTRTKNWGDGVFTIYAECKRCGVKGYADGDVEESIDVQHPSLRAETFEAPIMPFNRSGRNCPSCRSWSQSFIGGVCSRCASKDRKKAETFSTESVDKEALIKSEVDVKMNELFEFVQNHVDAEDGAGGDLYDPNGLDEIENAVSDYFVGYWDFESRHNSNNPRYQNAETFGADAKNRAIERIAKDGGWETLEERNLDRLDFKEVSVWNLKDMLLKSYDEGYNKGVLKWKGYSQMREGMGAETFEAKGDCEECYGTGGLYDSHMGINDECHSCGGTGFDY